MFPLYIPPQWNINNYGIIREMVDIPGAENRWCKPPAFKPGGEKSGWKTYNLTKFHGLLIWLETSADSFNVMYDRHMRRNLGFHTLDGDTMTGVVHPQMYGMPVPAFIFMDRTKHSFVPVMASSWMYPEKVASVKQPPSVLPHPSPQVLSVKPQNFINGLNRDAENSPTKSEGLRHPFLHERPTNVVTVMGDFKEAHETAGALWDKINKHPVGRKPSILAIARMAKVCWILCPTTTDAIVAVGIFGLLLKDDALIRFETNQGFTDFFNLTSDVWTAKDLVWKPSQISPPPNMTTQAHTLQSNLPDNSPSPQPPTSTVVDDMLGADSNLDGNKPNAPQGHSVDTLHSRLHDNGRSKPPPSSSVDDMWGAGSNLDGNASNARQGQSVDTTAPNPGSSTVEQEVFTFGQHNAGAPVAGDMWGAGSNLEGNASNALQGQSVDTSAPNPGSSTVEQEVFTSGQHNAGAPVAGDIFGDWLTDALLDGEPSGAPSDLNEDTSPNSMIWGPDHKFISDLNRSPGSILHKLSSDSGESMDIETPSPMNLQGKNLDLSPGPQTFPDMDFEGPTFSLMDVDTHTTVDHTLLGFQSYGSPTSELSALSELGEGEGEEEIEVDQESKSSKQEMQRPVVPWERIPVDRFFDKSDTHEVLFNEAGAWDAVYEAMFQCGAKKTYKFILRQILREKSSGLCSIHTRFGFFFTEGHVEEFISCTEEEAMEDFREEFQQRTGGHRWDERATYFLDFEIMPSQYHWVGTSVDHDEKINPSEEDD